MLSAPVLVVHLMNMLLYKLERREEDGINDARAAHRNTKAAIHMALEEFDLGGGFDFFAL
jgi:hypothetical protein